MGNLAASSMSPTERCWQTLLLTCRNTLNNLLKLGGSGQTLEKKVTPLILLHVSMKITVFVSSLQESETDLP